MPGLIDTDPDYREAHGLLHTLWSKTPGGPAYDKREWQALEAAILKLARRGAPRETEALTRERDDWRAATELNGRRVIEIGTENDRFRLQVAQLQEENALLDSALRRIEALYEDKDTPAEIRLLRIFEVANHMSSEPGAPSPPIGTTKDGG